LSGADTGGRYSLTEWTMAPPPAPGPPTHVHEDANEAIVVLGGARVRQIGEQTLAAKPDAVALVPQGVVHMLANPGPAPGRFLVILSPPGFEGYWRALAELLARMAGRPDPSDVLVLQRTYRMAGAAARRFV
jgi:mannose-6-phosphate isomerase-like protein (cupin superfamily)